MPPGAVKGLCVTALFAGFSGSGEIRLAEPLAVVTSAVLDIAAVCAR